MKKLYILYLCLFFTLSLAGCSRSHEEEIRSSVSSYFSTIQSGKYEDALKYTVGKNNLKDNFGFDDINNSVKDLKENSMGEVYDQEAVKFSNYILTKTISDYTIGSIEENSNEAIVNISGKCLDFDTFETSIPEDELDTLFNTYFEKHEDELKKLLSEKGEDAVNQYIIDACVPLLFEEMKAAADSASYRNFKMQITLEENDGQWKISQIEEVL